MTSIHAIIISPYPGVTSTTTPSSLEVELASLGFRSTTITIAAAKDSVWRGSELSNDVGMPVKMTWLTGTVTPDGTTIDYASAPDNAVAASLLRPLESPVGLEQPRLLKGDILLIREDGGDIGAAQVALLCEFATNVSLPNNPNLGERLFAEEFESLREKKMEDPKCSTGWADVVNPIPGLEKRDVLAGLTGNARKNKKKAIKAKESRATGRRE
ncbi:hypothetical protein DOTSEDRAFT_29694 [Dothistroma septosporum NZE10]|uniref:Uncharacterized protein n=1 Tax=Dothistroma septosporum (strain NZE10 / CBS 128990) TaxID=675120 RepID=M2XZI8_DOTSN|nr:hypothetical protein DOTSEDRAFT_29694 [Dothistroma septosporum NZE10]